MADRYEITCTLRVKPPSHLNDPRTTPRWIVEAWDMVYDTPHPCGTAYVARLNDKGWVMLEYVHVLREYRKKGVGTALVEWCKQQWPKIDGLLEDDACSDEGRALVRKITRAERLEKDEIV